MNKKYLAAAAATLAASLSLVSQAFGYAEYFAYGSYYDGGFDSFDSDDSSVHYNSSGGNVVIINRSHAWALVRADAANLDLGVNAAAKSLPYNATLAEASINTEASVTDRANGATRDRVNGASKRGVF